jgi:hypothetical protein
VIIGFGNRRKVANAINFVFVTAVVATAGINEVQQTPSHKVEYRHVTPTGAPPSGTYVKRVYIKSGEFLDYRYVTPGIYVPEPIPANQLVIPTISNLVQPLVVDLHGDEQKRKDYDKTRQKL